MEIGEKSDRLTGKNHAAADEDPRLHGYCTYKLTTELGFGKMKALRRVARLVFSAHLPGRFVVTEAEKPRVPQETCGSPFREANLSHQFGGNPLDVARRCRSLGKRRRGAVKRCHTPKEMLESSPVVTGADLTGVA